VFEIAIGDRAVTGLRSLQFEITQQTPSIDQDWLLGGTHRTHKIAVMGGDGIGPVVPPPRHGDEQQKQRPRAEGCAVWGSLAAMSDVIRFPIESARPPGPILMGHPATTRAAARRTT
jgi:hypothetical protein